MRLQVTGAWPQRQIVRKGWSKAHVRPWNDDEADAAIRLERGGGTFLAEVTDLTAQQTPGDIYSPALDVSATAVWQQAGYHQHIALDIMELRLGRPLGPLVNDVTHAAADDLDGVAAIDDVAFEGFWRIGKIGLEEALAATGRSQLLIAEHSGVVAGYAVVGAQFGTSFLQRIAVLPDRQGIGLGRDLLAASERWAMTRAAATMLLNVRPENAQAMGFYERWGFTRANQQLHVMKFG